MKKISLSVVTILALFSNLNLAMATAPSPSEYKKSIGSSRKTLKKPSPFMTQGFSLGLEYETVHSAKADITYKETGEVHQDVKSDTSTAPKLVGLNLGYKQISRGGFGFDFGLSMVKYDKQTTEDNPIIFNPTANVILAAPQYIYAAAGVNTGIVTGVKGTQYSPQLGYQLGVGLVIAKNFNLEVFHKWLGYEMETELVFITAKGTSTNARLMYTF